MVLRFLNEINNNLVKEEREREVRKRKKGRLQKEKEKKRKREKGKIPKEDSHKHFFVSQHFFFLIFGLEERKRGGFGCQRKKIEPKDI